VEVGTTDEVHDAIGRLTGHGLATEVQESTSCCFAVQDKVWAQDPDGAPWEYYTVLADVTEDVDLGCATSGCAPATGEPPAASGCC
jgi:hypothetical protein